MPGGLSPGLALHRVNRELGREDDGKAVAEDVDFRRILDWAKAFSHNISMVDYRKIGRNFSLSA